MRECVCVPVPHVPQVWSPLSVMPATHTPSPVHAHAPHVQSAWHMRVCWPHMPHAAPMSMSPGEQGPLPVQRPSSVHTPALQICRCMPQRAHAIIRGGSPVVQSQVVGAVHAAQTPSVQCSMPVPQLDVHECSDMRPTVADVSSQSRFAGMPS